MYLKEAFRYQNFLDRLILNTKLLLSSENMTRTIEEHHMHKFNPEANDETIDITAQNRTTEYQPDELLEFLLHLVSEKEALTRIIGETKRACKIDIDAEISNNKILHEIAQLLSSIEKMKNHETKRRGTGYKMNADGNQVSYTYDIKEVTTIDFNRHFVKASKKKLLEQADEVSLTIDKVMIETEVPYQPKYSISDPYDDVLDTFLSTKSNQ